MFGKRFQPEARSRLVDDAAFSRASWARRAVAGLAVIIYNVVGVLDVYSTILAIESGAGYESNPIVAAMMEHAGDGWVMGKVALQIVITLMVLWFPHWIVLGCFVLATMGNGIVVYNNFVIAGVF